MLLCPLLPFHITLFRKVCVDVGQITFFPYESLLSNKVETCFL